MFRRGTRAAFTLIELLVVIAIIGLLVAILIPALSSARTQAKATLCLTNLRTMGQGLVLYGNDNTDTLVPGRWSKRRNAETSKRRNQDLPVPLFRRLLLVVVG